MKVPYPLMILSHYIPIPEGKMRYCVQAEKEYQV